MLKKCLFAMMLATALVVVIPASTATAAPKSDAAVGATPQNPDSTQIRIAGGKLNLWGHEVKSIANLGGIVGVMAVLECPSPFGPVFPGARPFIKPPFPKGVVLIKAICRGVGKPAASDVVRSIIRMSTSPGRLTIGDNQCFQFRLQPQPGAPVIVNPSNCR